MPEKDSPEKDIRWIQRFSNFNKALQQLSSAVQLANQRELTDLEKQGLIQAFEFTHELAWKTLKDFLEARGAQGIYGSRDATRAAFQAELIANGERWMSMIQSRNQTSHTYNEETAQEILTLVVDSYYQEFVALQSRLDALRGAEQNQAEQNQSEQG